MNKLPVLFISHGGGPWPAIPEMREIFQKTVHWLSTFPKTLPEKPKAILLISAHWEEDAFTVSSTEHPEMIYDYSGFRPHTYKIKYAAKGSASVAARVQELLTQHGIKNKINQARGFDHGTFVPLMLMFPNADVPVVSMSIKKNYEPAEHIRMGEALASLREEGVLIIGSGLSYHNMRGFGRESSGEISKHFGNWLAQTIMISDPELRKQKLEAWELAPGARLAHPAEDHLVPLFPVVGAAMGDIGKVALLDHAMGVNMASYQFD